MNKKVLVTGLLASVLTVAVYAHGGNGDQDGGMMGQQQGQQGYMNQRGNMQGQQGQYMQGQRGNMQGRQGQYMQGQQGNMQGQQGYMNQRGNMQGQQGYMNQRGSMIGGQSGMPGKYGMMGQMMGAQAGMMNMFRNLNISNNQRYKISILREEMMLDMRKLMGPDHIKEMSNFITNKGFDKSGFIKEATQTHDKILKITADNMEKMFKLLTKKQITQLKKNIAN